MLGSTLSLLALSLLAAASHNPEAVQDGVHLPLYRKTTRRSHPSKRAVSGAIGIGDFQDVTYNVLVQVGHTQAPLVLDTGSSDLWLVSTVCKSCSGVPLYQASPDFSADNLTARLLYGDSVTGTHAIGPIGSDTVSLAGCTLPDQYFAAIGDTNTSVIETGSAGIFGLGFPLNSVIWNSVYKNQNPASSTRRDVSPFSFVPPPSLDLATRFLPSLDFTHTSRRTLDSRQSQASSVTPTILSSYSSIGPPLTRLVTNGSLSSPMFSVALQRDTVEVGGNAGILSLGALPGGLSKDNMTWVGVRGYPVSQGGLAPPPGFPNEIYPITWEVPIDDVFFDGHKLPRSNLTHSNISLSALIDTGNSLVRGPTDVIKSINNALSNNGQFPCSSNHTLAFQIGGRMFPVDPRDFATQAFNGSVSQCVANLAATDAPVEGSGYLYSWSIGDPFLKGVLAAFYYGNITHPSMDPPKIGFLSTVPPDAGDKMKAAVKAASSSGYFPVTSDPPLPGTLSAGTGVPQAQETEAKRPENTSAATRPAAMRWFIVWMGALSIFACV